MSYTKDRKYLKIYDRKAAPVYLDWIAGRHGVHGDTTGDESHEKIYLDVGCATGENILILAPLFPQVNFIGVDLNPDHILEALKEKARLGLHNAFFICTDFSEANELPQADYINLHGIYSWLSEEIKRKFEFKLGQLAKPGALLKLHFSVKPGAELREDIGHLFNTMQLERSPANARKLLELVKNEASGLKQVFSPAYFDSQLKHMLGRSDEMWWHDYLNDDFKAEYSDIVMARLRNVGFDFVASADMDQNICSLLATKSLCSFAADLPVASRNTFMDHVTGRAFRDDLFLKGAISQHEPVLHNRIRLGALWPRERMLAPHMTTQGQINFQHQVSLQIVDALLDKPLSLLELQEALPLVAREDLLSWLDLLMAAERIAPFMPELLARETNRMRLRELNRERLAESMKSFGLHTATPLLAAELGNRIEVGWFESLVFFHFHKRHEAATQQQMLAMIAGAGISLADSDGKPGKDQYAAFRTELAKLEQGYLSRLGYWGIEV